MKSDHGKGAHEEHGAPGNDTSQSIQGGDEGMHGDIESMAEDMYRRLLVSIPLTLLLLPYFMLVRELTGIEMPVPFGLDPNVFMFLLATPVVFYGGWMFYKDAIHAIKNLTPNLAVLVTISVLSAYIFSFGATFVFKAETFYEAATVLMIFILGGHWLDLRARGSASAAIRALLELSPPMARVIRDGKEVEISTAEVKVGDTVVQARRQDTCRWYGMVIEGESSVNEAMVTGESMPVHKAPGSEVIGATINQTGSFKFRATKVGADTALAQIVQLVAAAQASKPPAQVLADRAAVWLTLAAIIFGPLTFIIWYFFANESLVFSFTLAVTVVVVIACPDALGLATPMAIQVATTMTARRGILFKSAVALENSARLQAVIFDKTGTLTKGEPEVTDVMTAPEMTKFKLVTIQPLSNKVLNIPLPKRCFRGPREWLYSQIAALRR